MSKLGHDSLNSEQEELLVRFFDGECSATERRAVRKIIEQNEFATEYLSELGRGSRVLRDYFKSPEAGGDLWQRVAARIDQEERAELFLGKRRAARNWDFSTFFVTLRGITLSGAVATACLLFFLLPSTKQVDAPRGKRFQEGLDYMSASEELGGGVQYQAVSVEASNQSGRLSTADAGNYFLSGASAPRVADSYVPSTVEVDWVRSHGRVNLIQDPQERAPIIWIKKRDPLRALNLRPKVRDNVPGELK